LGGAGATVWAAPTTLVAEETLGKAASLGAARFTVLVVQATVQEEDTLRAVASVWAVATWWAGGGARWAVARALAQPIKHAVAVV